MHHVTSCSRRLPETIVVSRDGVGVVGSMHVARLQRYNALAVVDMESARAMIVQWHAIVVAAHLSVPDDVTLTLDGAKASHVMNEVLHSHLTTWV